MTRTLKCLTIAGALLLPLGGTLAWAQMAPAQAVKERQEIMKGIWSNYYRDMARAARGEITDLAPIAVKATQAGEALKKFGTLFPAGSDHAGVPESRAKPELWTQKADFDAALKSMIDETAVLGQAAKDGNADAVKAQYTKVAQACGGCHGGPAKSGGKFRFEEQ
jgi:cytochrome c556